MAQRLLEATMTTFDRWGVRHTGLFTFAQSTKHVALYQKFGYWPRYLTAIMTRTPDANPASPAKPAHAPALLSAFTKRQRRTGHPGLRVETSPTRSIGDSIWLAVRSWSVLLVQRTGDVVLTSTRGVLDAFAVCPNGTGIGGWRDNLLRVLLGARPVVVLEPVNVSTSCWVLAKAFASSRGATVEVGVNLAREAAYRRLRTHGHRVAKYARCRYACRPHSAGFNLEADAYVIMTIGVKEGSFPSMMKWMRRSLMAPIGTGRRRLATVPGTGRNGAGQRNCDAPDRIRARESATLEDRSPWAGIPVRVARPHFRHRLRSGPEKNRDHCARSEEGSDRVAADCPGDGDRKGARNQQPGYLDSGYGRQATLRLHRLLWASGLRMGRNAGLGISDGRGEIAVWKRDISHSGRGPGDRDTGLLARSADDCGRQERREAGMEGQSDQVDTARFWSGARDTRIVARPDHSSSSG